MTAGIKKDNEKTFKFYTRLHLRVLTGLKASNIKELLSLIKKVPEASIYYHTHHFLQQHQYLSPEPPNDFAYWITSAINEEALGEKVASIDTIRFSSLSLLRDEIANTIADYIKKNQSIKSRFASPEKLFHFIKSTSFVLPTPYIATNLEDFAEILRKITLDSMYFHLFEARLRLDKETNDFSYWLETSLLEGDLARRIKSLDPYTYTMEDLRSRIITIVEQRVRQIRQDRT